MFAHFGPNLQLPCGVDVVSWHSWPESLLDGKCRQRTLEKEWLRNLTDLGKVLADVLSRVPNVVAEGTGIACLASALPKELARDV